ncbi:MAG: heparinase II/III family protein [Verrucomicrobiota bacterium]
MKSRTTILRALFLGAVVPVLAVGAEPPLELTNPGFESGLEGWVLSKEDTGAGLSQISTEAAHSGSNGLRVKQDADGPGSWAQSTRVAVAAGKSYRLSFWSRCVEESGIGVWVQFFDAGKKPIPQKPDVAFQVPQKAGDWMENHLDVTTPGDAAFLSFAIHSYSHRACLADFDDFSLEPIAAPVPTPTPVFKPTAAQLPPPAPARVKAIAAMLDPAPKGVAPAIDNRAAWDALGADAAFRGKAIERAERFLAEPIADISAAYASSVQSGDRKVDAAVDRRRFRLATFILAEGMENQGRFLPAIDKEILAICAEPSWILSGHVKFSKGNDLGSAMTAWNLATAATILQAKLPESTQKTIQDEVKMRVINPYLDEIRGKRASEWWANNPNNWNAVVHGGIVGAALALVESADERAEIIAAAEQETQFYIRGFPEDGYSPEGMGYWKYGFGHYVLLSEAILAATHGKVNLYDRDNIRKVARFSQRFEMVPGVYPAYSDALFLEDPSPWLFHIIDHRYGLENQMPRSLALDGMFSTFLYAWGINLAFDSNAAPVSAKGEAASKGHQVRDWFEQSQVLVARPPTGQDGLTFSLKGGNNGTSHGHYDLGSFVVVQGGRPLLVDPGSTVYNGQTFGPTRFENPVMNSYGHQVPKVAGQLQKGGDQHSATVTDKKFSDTSDSLTLDLSKGYDVPSLRKLTRRFEYARGDRGALTVRDLAEFDSPQAFGTALITFGEARAEKPGVWIVSQNNQSVRAEISADGAPFTVTQEVLKDEARAGKVRRLGIDLNEPAARAAITVKITPVQAAAAAI